MKLNEMVKKYTKLGNMRLDEQYRGTKLAIEQIAEEKVKDFMQIGDVGLDSHDRKLLTIIIKKSMMQSFSLGFGVGKVEGLTNKDIYL